MKKTLLALALLGATMSSNAATVSGATFYDLDAAAVTYTASETPVNQFVLFGASVNDWIIVDITRLAFNSTFAIFRDIDGNLDANATYFGANSASSTFVTSLAVNGANTVRTLRLAAGNYVMRLNSENGGNVGISTVALSAVPLPAAAWLFGSALVGAGALRRKQSQTLAV